MTPELLLIQTLNGLQFGVLLFLMAAGLTLVFGIMSFVNLAHGALYMFGAYFAAMAWNASGSFALAVLAGFGGVFVLGTVIAISLVACALPARRAARTDPLRALRT